MNGFHARMRNIKQFTDGIEDPLLVDSVAELLSFRFSLSGFFDASEILVAKLKATYLVDGGSGGKPSMMTPRGTSFLNASVAGGNYNIYHRVAEVFLMARSRPQDLSSGFVADVCLKLSKRSPCTYVGGMQLFFVGLAAVMMYEYRLVTISEGRVPTAPSKLSAFIAALEVDELELVELHVGIRHVIQALEGLSWPYPILTYFYRSLQTHACRLRGAIEEAMKYAVLDPRSPSESVPLAVGMLKKEIALCKLASHDDRDPSMTDKRDNLSSAILVAKEAQVLLTIYECETELLQLKKCIVDCEERIRELLPSYKSGGKSVASRAAWLSLQNDDSEEDEK